MIEKPSHPGLGFAAKAKKASIPGFVKKDDLRISEERMIIEMEEILLAPPVAGALLFAVLYGLSRLLSRYSKKAEKLPHEREAYACGQRGVRNYVSPDYREFYPYAALFTLIHALVLVVATSPKDAVILPALLVLVTLFALRVVLRKGK